MQIKRVEIKYLHPPYITPDELDNQFQQFIDSMDSIDRKELDKLAENLLESMNRKRRKDTVGSKTTIRLSIDQIRFLILRIGIFFVENEIKKED